MPGALCVDQPADLIPLDLLFFNKMSEFTPQTQQYVVALSGSVLFTATVIGPRFLL